MDFEIVWTVRALTDLEAAVLHLHENPTAAEALRSDLLQAVKVLAQFPFIGPVYEAQSGQIHEIGCRRYRIFYQVDEELRRVTIVRVWHSARQEPRLP